MHSSEENQRHCHDCKEAIELEGKEIKNGFLVGYNDKTTGQKIKVFKCSSCFEKNPALTNFRKCEVYSRVVGYIRPVQQWHEGKSQEFKERQTFKFV